MSVPQKVRDLIDSDFRLDKEALVNVMIGFEREIRKGLGKATHVKSEIKCFVTYVQNLPSGSEKGKFLALDLGGTNFRVLLIHLKGEENYEFESKIYAIPEKFMTGEGSMLFDHIAECLSDFIHEQKIENETLALGFTFSFPCQQVGLTKGLLIKWTKGFNASNVVNKNVVELLETAISKRKDVKIKVCAILNDTTGTLMSCAWKHLDCRIGVIIGTGSNCCYVEKACKAELFDKPQISHGENVIINTECGAFGDHGSLEEIRNSFDREVDQNSINPDNQLFEKMISGMYMGELVRLVIVTLAKANYLFGGKLTEKLNTRYEFFTKYVSEIESQEEGDHSVTREILGELGVDEASDEECAIVRYICELVSQRSARLVSSAIASLLLRIGEPQVTVGVDGSVYRFHPKFHDYMTEAVRELVPASYKFKFVLSEDGSGRGAALVAAVAAREVDEGKIK